MNRKRLLGACALTLTLCAFVAIPSWGQGPGQVGRPGPHGFLKQALNKAGANALDSTQESALTTLISNFRTANRPGAPSAAEKAARDAYADAILSGGDTKTAADNLASVLSARQQARLEAEAGFSTQALSILHSDQIAALQNSVGKQGLLRVLSSFAGRPGGGPGPGMMGRNAATARAPRNRQ